MNLGPFSYIPESVIISLIIISWGYAVVIVFGREES